MITLKILLLPLAMLIPLGAVADDWKDESGKGKKHKREFKEEFWDGNCKVERKFKGNGDYKEKRKCKGGQARTYRRDYDDHVSYRADRRDYRAPRPAIVVTVPQRTYRAVAPVLRIEPAPRASRNVEPVPVHRNDPYSNLK